MKALRIMEYVIIVIMIIIFILLVIASLADPSWIWLTLFDGVILLIVAFIEIGIMK